MKKDRPQICVIGLGHFGAGLASTLAPDCEVLALDCDAARVNALADDVQRALVVDARDYQALAAVVSDDFDEAVVSIGEELESSILATLHLRRIGVPLIRAKAKSADHAEILRSVGASHVIFPEREAAERLATRIVHPNLLDFVPLEEDYRVMEIVPPRAFVGKSLIDLELRKRHGVFVIAMRHRGGGGFEFLPGPNAVVGEEDVLVLIGRESDILSIPGTKARQGGKVAPLRPRVGNGGSKALQQAVARFRES